MFVYSKSVPFQLNRCHLIPLTLPATVLTDNLISGPWAEWSRELAQEPLGECFRELTKALKGSWRCHSDAIGAFNCEFAFDERSDHVYVIVVKCSVFYIVTN
jgi:hypothetical protein